MKKLILCALITLTTAIPSYGSELSDNSRMCSNGFCVNDLIALEGEGLYQAIEITEDDYMILHGNSLQESYAIHVNILKKGFHWRDKKIEKIKSCEEESRIYSCTTESGYEVAEMKYTFDRNIVEPYLNNK